MEFKEKIVKLRKDLIMSQEELANAIGVSFATINRWEAGLYKATYSSQRKLKEFCDKKGIKFEE